MEEKRIFGLLGRKLGHSWSAPIHAELGQPDYAMIEREPEEVAAFLQEKNIAGLGVTMPYKKTVLPYCDVIDPDAQAIGSVNAIARKADGKLHAWNTDAMGFVWMAERAGISFTGKKVLVLGGSGGAALAVQAMVRKARPREMVVISRSGPDNYENLDRHADAEVVVNATPLGMFPNNGRAAVDLRLFPHCCGVLDVVYNPRRTALLLQAEELGIPHSDGLPMLVAQGVRAEELFFDRKIPDSEIERILALLRRDATNLVLIGMPGCGKNAVGSALAELTGREVLDLDARVADKAGCTIPELFAQRGERVFRCLEQNEAADCGKQAGKIIITGGGIVKDPRNYPLLHQNGWICHITRPLEQLATQGRPLSSDVEALWAERKELYARFRDGEVRNDSTPQACAQAVWAAFRAHAAD